MRELLKEARDVLRMVQTYFPSVEQIEAHTHDGLAVADVDACQKLAERIDTYLSAPSESAMEMVRKIREGATFGHDLSERYCKLLDTEAAALIADYGRRVPRAMLEEVANYARKQERNDAKGIDIGDIPFERIAAKHGVQVEDAE